MTTTDRWWRYARRAALVLVVVSVGGWLIGTPATCRDAVAGTAVVRVCEPVGLADVRVVGAALLVALLVVGDVGEIGLGGVTLKRAVAEVRAEVAETRRDVSDLGAAVVNTVDVVMPERRSAPGAVTEATASGSDTAAIAAFTAGFHGLPTLLPSWVAEAALVGYDAGDDGLLVPHTNLDCADDEVRTAVRLLDGDPFASVVVDRDGSLPLLAAPAMDDDGRRIGAVAVAVRRVSGRGPTSTVDIDELSGAVTVLAAAYSCLRRDLLRRQAAGG